MNTRRVMTWTIFWSSVVLALSALAWVSVEVVALERREASSRAEATRQESIRRALWRLDSTMAPVLAIETARPSSDYTTLDSLQRSELGVTISELGQTSDDGYATRYFNYADEPETQVETLRQLQSSPQALLMDQAQTETSSAKEAEQGPSSAAKQSDADFEARNRIAQMATQSTPVRSAPVEEEVQSKRAKSDSIEGRSLTHRDDNAFSSPNTMAEGLTLELAGDAIQPPSVGSLTPRWVETSTGPQLVLVRNAFVNGQPVVQGVELNWDKLRTDLLDSIGDVLPGALLVPSTTNRSVNIYRMATIPVSLIPPPAPALPQWSWSPARVGLLVTWIAIIATIIAVGVVLRAAIVLSQRRGHFVSAVTHELRTPLTTFRLYSQMLADGMVSDEQVRRDYLTTLKRESERLTGIVENVLEYARLSRVRPGKGKAAGVQTLSPSALVARFRPALARRLGQSNLDLVASLDLEEAQDRTITVDPHAVERVMMNLIENACKYAAPSPDDPSSAEEFDTRVHLDVRVHDETLELLVADHGPGIAPGERARIFGEFQRGSRGLGNARSGLGLGLALSRGLAREMGGDLQLTRRRGHGAEFLLTIPLDTPRQPDL